MLPDPLEPFSFLIYYKIILREKNTLENMANLSAPSLKIFFEYVVNMKTFLKRVSYAFCGSNVFVFS